MAIGVPNYSGSSTPYSSTSTLSAPPSPLFKASPFFVRDGGATDGKIPSSHVIEYISSRVTSSSTVYVYDLAEQVGFGSLTKSWSASGPPDTAKAVDMQTRAGAGLGLIGRLSEGTSKDTVRGAVLTAYTTPVGLAAMAYSLTYLPPPTHSSRLILQVPAMTTVGETLALSPSLSSLPATLSVLPPKIAIILSALPEESVDLAALSYRLPNTHVIHIFDHFSATREVGHALSSPVVGKADSTLSVAEAIQHAGYSLFDFTGDSNAQTVVVLLNSPLALTAKALAAHTPGLGVITVRVLRPWDEVAFRKAVPASAKYVHVFDDVPNEVTQGPLYIDVFSSLMETGQSVRGHRIVPSRTQKYLADVSVFHKLLLSFVPEASGVVHPLTYPQLKKVLFISTPKSVLSGAPQLVESTFLSNKALSARLLTDHDVFSKTGGISMDRMVLSPQGDSMNIVPIPALLPITSNGTGVSDLLCVLDHTLLKTHFIIAHAKPGSTVLLVTSWTAAEAAANLHVGVQATIRERNLRVCIIDAKAIAGKVDVTGSNAEAVQQAVVYLTFLRLYLGNAVTEYLVLKLARATLADELAGVDLAKVNARAWASLAEVDFPEPNDETEPPEAAPLKVFEANAIAVETEGDTIVNGARLGSWHDAAKHLLFPAVFTPSADSEAEANGHPRNPGLRPEVPEHTYLVTCTVNRRLTPKEYDRNVFHLEFDTSGTGLKYAIGEALGVHGWNEEGEVLDFCRWYGVNPDRLITIPVPGDESKLHTRTVFQALQQQIDLFGRPPKSFYTDLAEYATNNVDKHALRFIGSAEGASTLKKLSEKDTVTFADVLAKYTSARPGIEVLCVLVGDIKPRHYSIASAQSVVGDRVDLLVVTVEWATPSGSPRYGQCTRYLSGLKVGQKVTVSIKPSVMKLPPDNMQPIIMAGLGTGAAPFRAFLQHRAWLVSQNIPVGPTYYYFGSRHQSQEYLYGEEIEAWILDKVITRAGLAFSRDGPRKIYIQHKMQEDARDLARMLRDQEGVFYLCGPTWPVPDVYEALVGALVKYNGMERESAGEFLEGLKEEERYVLEVY